MKKPGKNLAFAVALMLAVQPLMPMNASAACFVLKEYNGRITLLEEGTDEPLAVYKTPLSALYPSDAELIKEGIRLGSRAEVSRLIEELELEK